jgi:RNA polymerase sigma-70 factor (ECF subfamily)
VFEAAISQITPELNLIASARKGDRQAYSELVKNHRDGVVNVVYRMCGDPELAEDAAQEAFIRAWKSLYSYQEQYPFRNWLYRIAINVALDALRRNTKHVALDDPLLRSDIDETETMIEKREQIKDVKKAIQTLPENCRTALVLREYEGLSYRDIAATLDIPLGTVMSRLNYARNHLRHSLAIYLEAE